MDIDLVGFALWFVAFLLAATCHEAGHALVARVGGDLTAYHSGQVSLNPWPHLRREPIGMIVVPILSFFWFFSQQFMIGWASAPYDPLWASRHPRRAAAMAAAGPGANLVLMLVAIAGIHLMVWLGVGVAPDQASFDVLVQPLTENPLAMALGRFLSILAMLNGLLFAFNLVPLPPLDGAAVLEGLGPEPVANLMARIRGLPIAGLAGLIIAWQVFPILFPTLFRVVLFLAHPTTTYG